MVRTSQEPGEIPRPSGRPSAAAGQPHLAEEVGEDQLQQMADADPNLTAATTYAMEHGYEFGTEFGFGLDLIVDGLRRLRDERDG
ncbi:MAG TPA: hypothetical protein VLD62_04045 [Acidimicrobiia bacterium]|nr:hypothetical protein [Acidimicrobiia bacterium]